MCHIGVLEAAHRVYDSFDVADMGKKAVAKPLAVMGPFDQTCDVDEFDHGGHFASRTHEFEETIQPGVWDLDNPDVRVDGCERVSLGRDTRRNTDTLIAFIRQQYG